MFNKETDLLPSEYSLPICLNKFILQEWVYFCNMTNQEKIDNPKAYVCDGYLKSYQYKEACKNMWDKFSESEKNEVKNIPNFDASIFEEITGIKV
jgi:hypothetical protein